MHNHLLENLKKEKYIHHLKTIFGGADQANMQLIIKFIEGIRFLLCVTDIFSKYAWVASLKDKEGTTITNAFQKILDESKRKRNKMLADKGNEFYKEILVTR